MQNRPRMGMMPIVSPMNRAMVVSCMNGVIRARLEARAVLPMRAIVQST